MTLTDFLLARIAEDEKAYRIAQEQAPSLDAVALAILDELGSTLWTTERLLADAEAKRRIVEVHALVPVPTICPEHHPSTLTHCGYCGSGCQLDDYIGPLLALPYADHPDYQPEWRR